MGTYIIRPTLLNSGGAPIQDNGAGFGVDSFGWGINGYPGVTILDGVRGTIVGVNQLQAVVNPFFIPLNYTNTLRFSFVGNCIYLDGSLIPISFAGLPAGFTALSGSVRVAIDSIQDNPPVGGTAIFNLQKLAGDNGPNNLDYPYDFVTLPIPTMLDLVNNGCGFKAHVANVPDIPGVSGGVAVLFDIFNLRVEGTYNIAFYNFTLSPPSGSSVDVGDTITITSPGSDILTDLDLKHLTVSMTCGLVEVIVQTPRVLTFTIPSACRGAVASTISVTGDGTQFSGTVALGTLTVLNTNASGLYTLVPGKTNDTLYRNARDGTTRDVAIPNPRVRTGFLND